LDKNGLTLKIFQRRKTGLRGMVFGDFVHLDASLLSRQALLALAFAYLYRKTRSPFWYVAFMGRGPLREKAEMFKAGVPPPRCGEAGS
jgi:hypothetical protein